MPGRTPLPAPPSRRRLLAAVIAILWPAALALLVLTTANPITLNRRQILEADAVVTAQVIDLESGTCRIVKQWSGENLPHDLVVSKLTEAGIQPAGEWILPLVRSSDGWEVIPLRLPSQPRLVYPATADAVRQLQEILDARSGAARQAPA